MYSSNVPATSDTSSFSTSCSTSPEINPTTPQKGSFFSWETIIHIGDLLQLVLKDDVSYAAVRFDEDIPLELR